MGVVFDRLSSARTAARPAPRARVVRGRDLDAREVDACFAVRCASVESRPGDPPDRAFFARALRACTLVTLMDAGGECVGFLGMHLDREAWSGGRGWVFEVEFAFVLEAWRGQVPYARPTLLALARRWSRAPLEPIFLCGACYPSSFCNAGASFCTPATLQSTSGGDDAAALALVRHLCETRFAEGFDAQRQRVRMPCIPTSREARRRWKDPVRSELFAQYDAMNPDWREGFGIVVAMRIRAIPAVLRWLGVQLGRRRR